MGSYITAAELRAESDVSDTLTDPEADRAIDHAEDLIDSWLGPRSRDATTGRLVVEAYVEPWQWAKLQRATVRLAARLANNPDAMAPAGYDSVSGPDFSKSGPRSPAVQLGDVALALNASGLRITGARAVA